MTLWAVFLWSLLLACTRAPAPAPPDPLGALEAQRRVLHAAEEAFLHRRVQQALARGDADAAAAAVAAGLKVAPERFRPLVAEVAPLASVAVAAELWTAADRRMAAEQLRTWRRADTLQRYAESLHAPHLAGVTLTHGAAVLRGVRQEYLVEPDEQAMAEAAHRRLGWVAQARAIAWPESSPQTVEDVLELAVAASIPEAVAVGEGVEAALASLDAFTRPVWPREIASWERHHAGVMVGVGLGVLDAPDGTVIVDVPWLGSPAWEADVRQRDQVMAVDDVSVADLDPPRAASVQRLLAGEPGSTVEVTLARPGASAAHAVHIERGPWPEQTVTGFARHTDNTWSPWLDEDAGIAFVRISAFRPSTHHDFDALLADLTPRALILDLRGNPGGDVNAAAHVTDRFVADGIVADLVGRAIEPPELADGEVSWNTALPGNHLEAVGELVVLIDEDTASAAELVAGALRERRGAILVGAESVGKGLSQGLRTDEGAGVAWQVTTGTWTLPSGTPLETPQGPSGLVPDRTVALSAAEGFQVSVLRRQREQLVTHRDGTPVAYLGEVGRPELPTLPADPQIATAVMLLTEP